MDQKHAMLYPDPNAMPTDQRTSAAASIGLPIEAPPSYDVAVGEQPQSSNQKIGWSSPATVPYANPTAPVMPPQHSSMGDQVVYPPTQVITNQPTVPSVSAPPHHHQLPSDNIPTTVQPMPPLSAQLGPNPSKVTCPSCGASKVSRMAYTPNSKTHLCAFILCLVGWCCCACVVPYCMNSCRTGNHYCPKCNTFLGAYNSRNNLL
ncbi:lipopolysaccharide-induced tumor necrosis factor-alpha factor [Musca autumnalis]|uniref:lipopolysaccharide-induced tumor necrosis factor-alpha factor n=1 Tax=Musca autumnalis TaxID=221902 RepID=UPI003CF958B5